MQKLFTTIRRHPSRKIIAQSVRGFLIEKLICFLHLLISCRCEDEEAPSFLLPVMFSREVTYACF
jgi:hypothetical protein